MSFIYKLDPRTKLLAVFLLTMLVFLVNTLSVVVLLLLLFIVIQIMLKIPFKGIKYLKNLSLLAAFIILMQTLFGPAENYILKPLFPDCIPFIGGMGSLKLEGFILGIVVVCRLFSLMLLFNVFTQTTSPHHLAMGLCGLGFKYRIAFILTTVFNLIPFIKDEASIIMDAQKLRGVNSAEKGFFFTKIKNLSTLALPLILGTMRKAQVSSVAMDCRAFGVYETRTWLDKPKMKKGDFIFFLVCVVFFTIILFLNYFKSWEYLWQGK